jgi:hypothetical protein
VSDVCACADFRAPVRTWPELEARAAVRERIVWTLDKLAGKSGIDELYRCRVCGQFWQCNEDRSGDLVVLFQVPAIDLKTWSEKPFRNVVDDAATRTWLLGALAKGEEVGPESCVSEGCQRLRIPYSTFCRAHHVEHLQRVGQLPEWPPDEA